MNMRRPARFASPQIVLATALALLTFGLVGWNWKHSRLVHREWQELAETPFSDAQAWGEKLENVRFSFGILHQFASALMVFSIIWLMLTLLECGRQMPPVKWGEYEPEWLARRNRKA